MREKNFGTRRLIYVPVIHGQHESFYQGRAKKEVIRELNLIIAYYFNELGLKLLSQFEKNPIHKSYADSFTGPEINPQNADIEIFLKYPDYHPVAPNLMLVEEGTRIMPTEHPCSFVYSKHFT